MWKFERVYRELLLNSLNEISLVRQKDVASRCSVSLGLVNKTVKKLEVAMAVEATRMGVRILSPARLLNLWAAERSIGTDFWRSFRLDPVGEVEKDLPPNTLFSGFSAWVLLSGRRPAEYHRLYFYVTKKEDFDFWLRYRREKIRKTNPNVFALYTDDEHLVRSSKRGVVCVPQIYVDIYSINGPEASPFLRDIVKTHPSLSLW